MNIPLFITEFGSCDDSEGCVAEINSLMDAVEEYNVQGWAYWQFKLFKDFTCTGGAGLSFYDDEGNLSVNKIQALARTYIKGAQGTIQKQSFTNGVYEASVTYDSSIQEATELYVYNFGLSLIHI